MTIEEDFEQVRECLIGIYGKDPHAALDRIEGYIEQCADFQHAAEEERDALRAALEEQYAFTLRVKEGRDDLLAERDALKVEKEAAQGMWGNMALADAADKLYRAEQERDALKAQVEADERAHLADKERGVLAMKVLLEERDVLKAVLERIQEHVGNGAGDIVVANTILGRINKEARQALAKLEEK